MKGKRLQSRYKYAIDHVIRDAARAHLLTDQAIANHDQAIAFKSVR
jgi:hypothetical protein